MIAPILVKARRIRGTVLVAGCLGLLIGFVISHVDEAPPIAITLFAGAAGVMLGLLIGFCEEYLVPSWGIDGSFRSLTAKRFAFYLVSIIAVIVLNNAIRMWLVLKVPLRTTVSDYLTESGPRDMLIALFASIFLTYTIEISRLHSLRELWYLLSGKYHQPVVEERLFLFADLKGSSSIAERLGPVPYSLFLRDVFNDLEEVITMWHGRVYQYLGDGLIVTWSAKHTSDWSWSLRCFQEMRFALNARQAHYRNKYDTIPTIRSGLHAGSVVTTRVGQVKSEFAMHGDAINVAARLQSLCAKFDTDMVVSQPTLASMNPPAGMTFSYKGKTSLKGRSKGEEISTLVEEFAPTNIFSPAPERGEIIASE